MKKISSEEKKKLISVIENSKKEVRAYVSTRVLPLEILLEMAITEENEYVLMSMLKKLEQEKENDEVKQSYIRLAEAKSWQIRQFVATYAPISVIIEMALYENDKNVKTLILDRLKAEANNVEVKEKYSSLSNAMFSGIREFVAMHAPISVIIDMTVYENDLRVVNMILERLENELDSDVVQKSYDKLTKAKDYQVREVAAKYAPIPLIIDMLLDQNSSNIEKIIFDRLEKEFESDEVQKNITKLAKVKNCQIRKKITHYADISTIIKMSLTEENADVVKEILEKLEDLKDTEEVKKCYTKLSKSNSGKIRAFAVQNADISTVIKIALIDKNIDVIKEILKRLELEIDNQEVQQSLAALAKAQDWHIRKFVAQIVPIKIVLQMALTESDLDAKDVILERLKNNKESTEVKESYSKLATAKYFRIREYVVNVAPTAVVVQMALVENDKSVIGEITKRLMNDCSNNIDKEDYSKLSKAETCQIREFVAKYAPIEVVIQMALTECDIDVKEVILERLKNNKESTEVKESYSKLAKAKCWQVKAFVMTYASDEVIQSKLLTNFDKEEINAIKNLI